MKCYICEATSQEFNNLVRKKEVKSNVLKFVYSVCQNKKNFLKSITSSV